MKSNAAVVLAAVLHDEGGFAIRDTEGGGAVNRGVTFTVFKAWRLSHGKPEPTFDDLKAMGVEEAGEIYAFQYFAAVHFDDLPPGVDYAVLDASITGGPTGAIEILQGALGAKVDGHYGLATRWAVQHRPIGDLIDKICDARIAKYKTFSRFKKIAVGKKTWGQIWTERIERVRVTAHGMVTPAALAPQNVAPPITTALVQYERDLKTAATVTLPKSALLNFPPAIQHMPASTDLSRGMIKRGGTAEQFLYYLHDEAAPMMRAWRPSMIVLHNTGSMKWPGEAKHADGSVTPITPEQRLDNMSVGWTAVHFPSTPHLVISPDGMIWLAWPLWKPGTHSPSWNRVSWGIETVGDFDFDQPTPEMLRAITIACAGLFSMLGRIPNGDSFKLHKEDPDTQHKRCPGKNLGSKAVWLDRISTQLKLLNPLS